MDLLQMRLNELRKVLLAEERALSRSAHLESDPAKFAHAYRRREDQEVVALVSALLAFGSVKAFLPKIRSLLEVLGRSPRRYIASFEPTRDSAFFDGFRLRVYTGDDLRLLLQGLRAVLEAHANLEDAFLAGPRRQAVSQAPATPATLAGPAALRPRSAGNGGSGAASHKSRLTHFAGLFRSAGPCTVLPSPALRSPALGSPALVRSYRHLVVDPAGGSACKRWNLFLRWVVRPSDGVDLGLWKRVDPADLIAPLDLHVGRISGLLGLRTRQTLDWKAAEEVTASLRLLDPRDPLRFDFCLSHIGISKGCRGRPTRACDSCGLSVICGASSLWVGDPLKGLRPARPPGSVHTASGADEGGYP